MKENRTYDQLLGDLTQGNGDPLRYEFPRPVTPNTHGLAERFALLDDFDTAGDVWGDGWNWTFQGHANDYTNRTVDSITGIPFCPAVRLERRSGQCQRGAAGPRRERRRGHAMRIRACWTRRSIPRSSRARKDITGGRRRG